MAEHKPGPWLALSPAEWARSEGQWVVPGVAHCGNGELSEANARLIAAAPDLLAALKALLPFTSFMGEMDTSERECAKERARAAIAKAEGKP